MSIWETLGLVKEQFPDQEIEYKASCSSSTNICGIVIEFQYNFYRYWIIYELTSSGPSYWFNVEGATRVFGGWARYDSILEEFLKRSKEFIKLSPIRIDHDSIWRKLRENGFEHGAFSAKLYTTTKSGKLVKLVEIDYHPKYLYGIYHRYPNDTYEIYMYTYACTSEDKLKRIGIIDSRLLQGDVLNFIGTFKDLATIDP